MEEESRLSRLRILLYDLAVLTFEDIEQTAWLYDNVITTLRI